MKRNGFLASICKWDVIHSVGFGTMRPVEGGRWTTLIARISNLILLLLIRVIVAFIKCWTNVVTSNFPSVKYTFISYISWLFFYIFLSYSIYVSVVHSRFTHYVLFQRIVTYSIPLFFSIDRSHTHYLPHFISNMNEYLYITFHFFFTSIYYFPLWVQIAASFTNSQWFYVIRYVGDRCVTAEGD